MSEVKTFEKLAAAFAHLQGILGPPDDGIQHSVRQKFEPGEDFNG